MDDRQHSDLSATVGTLDHVALIVDDLDSEAARYRELFSAEVSPRENHAQYGCSSAFVDLGYSKLRLFAADGAGSPIAAFWGPHPVAGIHHVCYLVEEIEQACSDLRHRGFRLLGNYKRSSQGKRMIFLRPAHMPGPLVKLEQR